MKINYILKEDFDDIDNDQIENDIQIQDNIAYFGIINMIKNMYDIYWPAFASDPNNYTIDEATNWEPHIQIIRNSDLDTPYDISVPYIVRFNKNPDIHKDIYTDDLKLIISVKDTARNIKTLINDVFVFEYADAFHCSSCNSLVNLNGSPLCVAELFCYKCTSLSSLEGCPHILLKASINHCNKLTNIKGLSDNNEKLRDLDLSFCKNIQTLEGMPNHVDYLNLYGCTGIVSDRGYTFANYVYIKASLTDIRLAYHNNEVKIALEKLIKHNKDRIANKNKNSVYTFNGNKK